MMCMMSSIPRFPSFDLNLACETYRAMTVVLILHLILCLQMGDRLIPGLMPGNYNETICVNASRFCDFYDPHDESKLLHSDLVLIDEEVHIVACLPMLTCMLTIRLCIFVIGCKIHSFYHNCVGFLLWNLAIRYKVT